MTRRGFVGLAALAAGGVLSGRSLAAPSALHSGARAIDSPPGTRYLTQPDWQPPLVEVLTPAIGDGDLTSGLIFVAPFHGGADSGPAPAGRYGPMILDNAGEPVWFLPLTGDRAMDFRVQQYLGKNVLTWFESNLETGYGTCVIYDSAYGQLRRVHAAHGLSCDLHEFLITSRNTALISVYRDVPADLSSIGGPVDGRVIEGIVQELALPSGELLFEWHSLDHVALDESFQTQVTDAGNVDYLHLNSIGVDRDGDLLVSARHTSTVYKIDRKTGEVKWRLGGKKTDFSFGPGAAFNYQHDVRRHPDGTLTIFDNGAVDEGAGDVEPSSRALRISVDGTSKTVSLVSAFEPPGGRLTVAMGDVQELPAGDLFVGWGTAGAFSEFGPDGSVRLDARFEDGSITYRAFRLPWNGVPGTKPIAVARANGDGTASVAMSWNGATDVSAWQVLAGPSASALTPAGTAARAGFETTIVVPAQGGYVAARALDAAGKQLGQSLAVSL